MMRISGIEDPVVEEKQVSNEHRPSPTPPGHPYPLERSHFTERWWIRPPLPSRGTFPHPTHTTPPTEAMGAVDEAVCSHDLPSHAM